jgi:hypothetical protein
MGNNKLENVRAIAARAGLDERNTQLLLRDHEREYSRRKVARDSKLAAASKPQLGFDRSPHWHRQPLRNGQQLQTNHALDQDGRLFVSKVNLTASGVRSYLGAEINQQMLRIGRKPTFDKHDFIKVYFPPKELKLAAHQSDGLPVILGHDSKQVIGWCGHKADFTEPFLSNQGQSMALLTTP